MRKLHFAALRANGACNCLARVVGGTTGMGLHPAGFTLGYCHLDLPFLQAHSHSNALNKLRTREK